MNKSKLALILFLSLSVFSLNAYAQSGRNRPTQTKPDKTERTKNADDSGGVTESNVGPNGETVEGDVIR